MTKAEKQVLKSVYLEQKETKVYYRKLAQALEDKYPVYEAGSPEQKELKEFRGYYMKYSAIENATKELIKELAQGQDVHQWLGITIDDIETIIEYIDKCVARYMQWKNL